MSVPLGLHRLQQVDSHTDRIRARLKAIEETLQADDAIRSAQQAFAASESAWKTAERDLRFAEAESIKQRVKIEQAESSLYGGQVRNPKELQDLQDEIASLKRHLITLENRELDALAASEAAEAEYQIAQAELNKARASAASQHADLTVERETLQKDSERLIHEHKAAIGAVPQPVLQIYEQLRERKHGLAVVAIQDSACAACGSALTPAQQQSARSASQLFYCPTCGRILYAS